ncbi:photosystem II cytochrome c-550 [Spirulina sp. 06S082]|uniref:photosystem II cytochrome c-550 n=1 Tax=Spirulina sp. 06S082 TaxID=3110248 RepID=UPI002B211BC9|nr:photosystem II cytochrome c-550 [Spirulina sp. 06S082]MEA5468500.1 photosystem II cytochrome c-550 [Spirulina sp. 06S082]
MRFLKVAAIAFAMLLFSFQIAVDNAQAVNVDEVYRTVTLNSEGETVVITNKQLDNGRKIFNDTCSQCHMAGRTKTNPNITLKSEDLEGAFPSRDNVLALVDFINDPKTYDGEESIDVLHPSMSRLDLWSEMRKYNQDDLYNLAGYILVQPNLKGEQWGGGKTIN